MRTIKKDRVSVKVIKTPQIQENDYAEFNS